MQMFTSQWPHLMPERGAEPAGGHVILSNFLQTHHLPQSATQIQTHGVKETHQSIESRRLLHSPVWTWWPGCFLSSVTRTGAEREGAWPSGRVTSFDSWNHFHSQATQELLTWWIPQPGKVTEPNQELRHVQVNEENV